MLGICGGMLSRSGGMMGRSGGRGPGRRGGRPSRGAPPPSPSPVTSHAQRSRHTLSCGHVTCTAVTSRRMQRPRNPHHVVTVTCSSHVTGSEKTLGEGVRLHGGEGNKGRETGEER
eukprot:3758436-Rhodomonas_salina.1